MRADSLRSILDALRMEPSPGIPGDAGLFGPSSLVWHVGRERVLLAGGTAALLLQVAHPLVAAGVAAHSDFSSDPLRRLRVTLDATLTITFGDTAQAHAAAATVRRRHRSVHGVLPTPTGSLAAGTPYRADDPDLALWVFCTLVWSAVATREEFVGRLTRGERDTYYDQIKDFGRLFGVTGVKLPADYHALTDYFDHMIESSLAVGPAARVLAGHILTLDEPVLPWPIRHAPGVLSAALLPAQVREAYGLRWRRRERFVYAALRLVTRSILPVLPARVRYWPHYREALLRMSPDPGPALSWRRRC